MRIRTYTAPAVLVTGTLLLTACGGSPLEGKNGPEVAGLAADALEEAGSARLSGTITQGGQESEIDMRLQGDAGAGTLTVQGIKIELINVDGDSYLKGNEALLSAFFGLSGDAAADLEGQWIQMSGDNASDFSDFTLDSFLKELRDPEDGKYEDETSSDEVDGDSVIVVDQEDGPSLSVKDDDPPYPLQLSDEEGTVTFSEFGEEQDISAPDDVVPMDEVLGG